MGRIGQFTSLSPIAERGRLASSRSGLEELLADAYERGFSQSLLPTVGLEEELILVDSESREPPLKSSGCWPHSTIAASPPSFAPHSSSS